jgi:hypothetical protein
MPGPALGDAHTRPPCASMIERTIESPHAQAIRFGRVESAEQPVCILGLDTDTGIFDRHQHAIGLMALRADDEHALPLAHRRHGFHAVDEEIDDHLLQLDSIPAHREQARREFEPNRNSVPKRVMPQERDRLSDDLVDVQADHLRVDLLRELANPANHLIGAMGVVDNLPDRGAHFFDLGRLAAEPPQAGSRVGYDGAERLIHFMRDRRGHLSEHGHARDMASAV